MDEMNRKGDEEIRNKLDQLPEEGPESPEWKKLSEKLAADGVFKEDRSNWRALYILLALIALVGIYEWVTNTHPGNPVSDKKAAPSEETVRSNREPAVNPKEESQPKSLALESNKTTNDSKVATEQLKTNKTFAEKTADDKANAKTISEKPKGLFKKKPKVKDESAEPVSPSDKTNKKTKVPDPLLVLKKNDKQNGKNSDGQNVPEMNPVLNEARNEPEPIVETRVPRETKENVNEIQPAVMDETTAVKKDSALALMPDPTPKTESPDSISKDEKKASLAKRKRWSAGPYASFDRNHFQLKSLNDYGDDMISNGSFVKNTKTNFQFTTGANIHFAVSENLGIESGIWYSQKQKILDKYYFIGNTSSVDALSYSHFTYNFSGRYLEVPLKIKWNFLSLLRKSPAGEESLVPLSFVQKFNPYISAGASYTMNLPVSQGDYFINTKETTSGTTTEQVNLNSGSVGVVGQLAFGCDYRIGKKISIYIEPTYRYSFNPAIKPESYREIPMQHFIRTISIAGGLYYEF